MTSNLPEQRWRFGQPNPQLVELFSQSLGLSRIMAEVIINRGLHCTEDAEIYINPEAQTLPSPVTEFPDLAKCLDLLTETIAHGSKIAICGDYDADGMTSTALLIRALRHLGAKVDYAIPSRMQDGYGINNRIVKEFKEEGVSLILTVDNGISAYEPIALAKELGLKVIITDHHDLPSKLPPADGILNPKLLPPSSPYKGLAGVGVAYVLGVTLAQKQGQLEGLTRQLLELYTLGTIADLAPLTGVNRRWLKRGLKLLADPQILGIQALIKVGGVDKKKKTLSSDDIGFKLGPRINAIGRISDPQIVIELLTTEDESIALQRASECHSVNQKRQELCNQITKDAIAFIEEGKIDYKGDRFLLLLGEHWHHGVIGIVASRLVERYGVPVFIATYEDEEKKHIRGSARGTEEYNIFKALQYCDNLLLKYGGHKAAGGFGFETKNLDLIKDRLREFSHQLLSLEHLKPLLKVDSQISFYDADFDLIKEIESLYPWGIENDPPIFWTPDITVISQKLTKTGEHLQLTLQDESGAKLKCIAWQKSHYYPLPPNIDVAYKLSINEWRGEKTVQLDIQGIK
ncbi:single-stranded-DNA-specific exonuclease RecJ [Cyanobacterium sp. HL-69]|uniref:single-stranded-DNA-specific exonuclease RecJ n=1 Tax=Cyanobacterium sp. HL-69 TaxID=2054282 RepID=UPI000CA1837C|nr:single-stranded-DNA-specific exonuclease RecJ [Cyanobacterium sp. HL-69]